MTAKISFVMSPWLAILALPVLIGIALLWQGRRMKQGHISPVMGDLTVHNSTPTSWKKMQAAISAALTGGGWSWIFAAVVAGLVPWLGLALMVLASLLLVSQIVRASTFLDPVGPPKTDEAFAFGE